MIYKTNGDHDASSTCIVHDCIELIYNTYSDPIDL